MFIIVAGPGVVMVRLSHPNIWAPDCLSEPTSRWLLSPGNVRHLRQKGVGNTSTRIMLLQQTSYRRAKRGK